jgi:hypothetical protein
VPLTEASWFSAVVIRDSGSNWLSSLSLVKLSPIKVSRVEVTID